MNDDKDHARRGGPALEKAYQFVLWVVPVLKPPLEPTFFVLVLRELQTPKPGGDSCGRIN